MILRLHIGRNSFQAQAFLYKSLTSITTIICAFCLFIGCSEVHENTPVIEGSNSVASKDSASNEEIDTTLQIEDRNIFYLKSTKGGCNIDITENKLRSKQQNDTSIISIVHDTLNIHVGLRYICCAPFTTNCEVLNDSIFISIKDTCSNPHHDCYCRCYCYYIFDYYFADLSDKEYYWQINLTSPLEDKIKLFDKGIISGCD